MELPISEKTWAKLIDLNEAAAWAEKGVFATAKLRKPHSFQGACVSTLILYGKLS